MSIEVRFDRGPLFELSFKAETRRQQIANLEAEIRSLQQQIMERYAHIDALKQAARAAMENR